MQVLKVEYSRTCIRVNQTNTIIKEWFQAAAKSKCSRIVTITENQAEVQYTNTVTHTFKTEGYYLHQLRTADIVLYHAPTHHTGAVAESRFELLQPQSSFS